MIESREVVVVSGMAELHLLSVESSEDEDWTLGSVAKDDYMGWFQECSEKLSTEVDGPLPSSTMVVFNETFGVTQGLNSAPGSPLKAVGAGADFKLVPCSLEERKQITDIQNKRKAEIDEIFKGEGVCPDTSVVLFVRANPGSRSQELTKKFGKGILKLAHNSPRLEYRSDGPDKRWYLKEKLFKTDTHNLRDNFTANT